MIQNALEDIWPTYVLMSSSQSREGGIGHRALTLHYAPSYLG